MILFETNDQSGLTEKKCALKTENVKQHQYFKIKHLKKKKRQRNMEKMFCNKQTVGNKSDATRGYDIVK